MLSLVMSVILAILIIGSITDLKTREVPDYISYAGIAIGLGISSIVSVSSGTTTPFFLSLGGLIAAWGLASALYYLGQWGGGDSKVLIAMGTLLGLPVSLFDTSASFLINLVFAGGVYGFIWMMTLALKNFSKTQKMYSRVESEPNTRIAKMAALGGAIILLALGYLARDTLWWFPLVLFGVLSVGTYYLFVMLRAVERVCFITVTPVSRLTEGDWIIRRVVVSGKELCGPKDLGISKEQIENLKQKKVQNVVVKSGIPFIPSFLIAFLITITYGNVFLLLL